MEVICPFRHTIIKHIVLAWELFSLGGLLAILWNHFYRSAII